MVWESTFFSAFILIKNQGVIVIEEIKMFEKGVKSTQTEVLRIIEQMGNEEIPGFLRPKGEFI